MNCRASDAKSESMIEAIRRGEAESGTGAPRKWLCHSLMGVSPLARVLRR